jgi:tRNA-dihydrouridine synthase
MLLAESEGNGKEAQGKMKQFASWFTHGVAGGAALRKAIYEAKAGETILSAVEQFFEEKSQLFATCGEHPATVALAGD